MAKIRLQVRKGKITYVPTGGKGQRCHEMTLPFEKAFGDITSEEKTPEADELDVQLDEGPQEKETDYE